MGKRPEWTISKEIYRWPSDIRKMLNITNHQRNTDQKHNETSPHTWKNGYHQKSTDNKCWWGCTEKGTLICCWWDCKLGQPLLKTVWGPQKIKSRITTWSSNSIAGKKWMKKRSILIRKDTCTPIFIVALFTITKIWKQS